MFGISFSEIILILIIAVLVLGPKQLPEIVIKARKLISSFKNFANHLKQEVYQQSGFNELNVAKERLINGYHNIKDDIFTNESTNHPQNPVYELKETVQPELEFDKDPELF